MQEQPNKIYVLSGYYRDESEKQVNHLFKSQEDRKKWLTKNRGYFIVQGSSEVQLDPMNDPSNLNMIKNGEREPINFEEMKRSLSVSSKGEE